MRPEKISMNTSAIITAAIMTPSCRAMPTAVMTESSENTMSSRRIWITILTKFGAVTSRLAPNFVRIVIQILLLDIVFSLDSVITAVGMARQLGVMIAAVIIALR